MLNNEFVALVESRSLNTMSSDSVTKPSIYALCNMSLYTLFQKMNSATTLWKHSFEIFPVTTGTKTVTLPFSPMKIVEVSNKSGSTIYDEYASLEMITDWNQAYNDESYTRFNYELNWNVLTFTDDFIGNVFYIREPKTITVDNLSEELDCPDSLFWYLFYHALFSLMPFILTEWATLANTHYEHAKELLNDNVRFMNKGIIWFRN